MRPIGDYNKAELKHMSADQLIEIIFGFQSEDNFIIMTDSYKMTHHLLYPSHLKKVYSYMEPRGGEMPYTVFFGLQYYLMRYLAGRRITPEKIEEARQANIAHFGFDCFDDTMWKHIVEKHDGRLPLRIRAVPEGTTVAVKNVLMDIKNTDFEHCAALTNITETLLMKLWATNTVAAYNRAIKELITKYHKITSTAPEFLINFMHHDFGYRGVSSEETGRLAGAAALVCGLSGTDTMGALKMIKDFYYPANTPWMQAMAGYSVIASEHSVMCSYGGKHKEADAYREIIRKVKNDPRILDANPASGLIILSLVSDTYNIYNVCDKILPELQDEFIGWKNNHGIPIKIVVRPDSGNPMDVLFGVKDFSDKGMFLKKLAEDMGVSSERAFDIMEKGVFGILFDRFGSSVNEKGFRCFNPQIGVLQGDGVSIKVIENLYERMVADKIDIMNLVFGSGGKNLQAHDRDEQKYAIKATSVQIGDETIAIQKKPITDSGKDSKVGELKLVKVNHPTDPDWMNYRTVQEGDPGYSTAEDRLIPVFENGEILVKYTFPDVRKNCII